MMGILHLTRTIYDQIRAHGEQTYPNECCGALLGESTPEGWRVEAAVAAGNTRTDSPRNRYQIAPLELVKIEREARSQGIGIAGFYHSHPDHPAHWSLTDLAEAHWLGCSYVITAIAQGKANVTNSFLLAGATEEEKHFEQETILVEDEPTSPHFIGRESSRRLAALGGTMPELEDIPRRREE
jgi:proteasome lid subunit RPN8/RPN11